MRTARFSGHLYRGGGGVLPLGPGSPPLGPKGRGEGGGCLTLFPGGLPLGLKGGGLPLGSGGSVVDTPFTTPSPFTTPPFHHKPPSTDKHL